MNTYVTDQQSRPEVITVPSGNVVIAWESSGQDGDLRGVFAQQVLINPPVTPSPSVLAPSPSASSNPVVVAPSPSASSNPVIAPSPSASSNPVIPSPSASSNPVVVPPSPSASLNPVVAPPLPSASSNPVVAPPASSAPSAQANSANNKSESPTWKTAAIIGGSVAGGITFFFCVAYLVFKKATKNIKEEFAQTGDEVARAAGNVLRNASQVVRNGVGDMQDTTRGQSGVSTVINDEIPNPGATRVQQSDAGDVPSLVSPGRRRVRRKSAGSKPAMEFSARKPAGLSDLFKDNTASRSDSLSAGSHENPPSVSRSSSYGY